MTSDQGIAVITGGGSGMGRAIAHTLADQGWRVLIAGRREAMLQQTAAVYPHLIEIIAADVATTAGIDTVMAAIASRPVALLIPAAGVFSTQSLKQLSPEHWQQMLAINVSARLLLVQALQPQLFGGRILFIGSRSASTARQGALSYCVTQAASQMLQQCLKKELVDANITVGSVIPGPVDSHIMQQGLNADPAIYPDAIKQRQEPRIAADTFGKFAAWLLLATTRQQFTAEQWDIRDQHHHRYWLQQLSLYQPSAIDPITLNGTIKPSK